MAKGLVAGILATAAAYVAFKALPQEKQDELVSKAKDAGNKLKDHLLNLRQHMRRHTLDLLIYCQHL